MFINNREIRGTPIKVSQHTGWETLIYSHHSLYTQWKQKFEILTANGQTAVSAIAMY